MSERVAFHAYRKIDGEWDWTPAGPPEWCVAYVHEAQEYPGMPPLNGILETPAVRRDGTIAQAPGYDAASGYFLAFDAGAFPTVPDQPTQADAREALAALREVFQDFPFAGTADRDVPIAAVLTIIARPAIRGAVPAFLFDASSSRSGKGFMLNAVSLIALGHAFAPMNYPSGKDELEKVLGGYAMRGVPLIAFDNIDPDTTFGGGPIERAVTAEDRVALRVLGKTETPELTWRATVIGTGNNVTCTRDMSARVIRARLVPTVERPEDIPPERFAHYPLLPWVRAERPRLVAAALTLVRAYFVAGQPRTDARPVADFSAWARVVRDAIVWAGGADVAITRAEAAATDTKGDALARLMTRMHEIDPKSKGLSASDWFNAFGGLGLGARVSLSDALDDLGVKDAATLGVAFRGVIDRVKSGLQLKHAGTVRGHGGKLWAVFPVGGGG